MAERQFCKLRVGGSNPSGGSITLSLVNTLLRELSLAARPSSRWSLLPAALSLGILALQMVVPWTTAPYITQDGPSHLYTALVARDLFLHPHGLYASAYMFHHRLTSNWGTIVLFNLLAPVFGAGRAEAALASLSVLIAFACVAYFRRSVDSTASSFDPMTNFLVNTWFLWVGYYNFYLGMVAAMLLVGFCIRHSVSPTKRQAVAFGAALTIVFFVHVIGAALAIMAALLVFAWRRRLKSWRAAAPLLVAMVPAAILLGFFVKGYSSGPLSAPELRSAWDSFPMHVFASARGRAPEEALLVPAILFVMVAGLAALRRREWATVRFPLAVAALACFAAYLFVPDIGFGGGGSKIRFAWAVFLFGCPAALSGARMRALRTPLSSYVACFMTAGLITTLHLQHSLSPAVEAYASALRDIPEGSTIMRMRFAAQDARNRFGFDELASDPLLHADSWIASQRRLIDLTDYQAPLRLFPVAFAKSFSGLTQQRIYSLEGGESARLGRLKQVLEDVRARPSYVVLFGDEGSREVRDSDFASCIAWLDSNLEPVAQGPFIRVYRTR